MIKRRLHCGAYNIEYTDGDRNSVLFIVNVEQAFILRRRLPVLKYGYGASVIYIWNKCQQR